MSRSPFDPHANTPSTFRERLAHKVKRTVEPLAIHLLDWCRSLNTRIDSAEARIENGENALHAIGQQIQETSGQLEFLDGQVRSSLSQVCALDGQFRTMAEKFPQIEAADAVERSRVDELFSHLGELSVRADQAEWGREALVQRLNEEDARMAALGVQLDTLGQQVVDMHWAREALVERLVEVDAGQGMLREKIEKVEVDLKSIPEEISLPQAFGLDALAMGRRIAALEDQVEALLMLLARENAAIGAALVPFPKSAASEKAAG
jgi:chromosome segregation ATPase